MSKQSKLEQDINELAKKLQVQAVRTDNHGRYLRLWLKKHEVILITCLIIPAFIIALKAKGGLRLLFNGTKQISRLVFVAGLAQAKTSAIKALTKKIH